MLIVFFCYNCILFLIGLVGIVLNRKNILVTLMCIELMLLALNLNWVTASIYTDDILGQIFCLFILTVAAAESSIGLAILICYYRTFGSIRVERWVSLLRH